MLSKVAHLPARSTRYLESGGGRACVLLHAFPLCAEQWLPQLHRPPAGWRFIAPDLRGFRGTGPAFEQPGLPDTAIDDYADDVLALMAYLEVDRAAVAGSSMGGYVALALLRRAAARVSGLVLADTRASADAPEARAGRQALLDVVGREGAPGVARAMLPKLLGETTRREQPDLVETVRRMIERNPPEAVAAAIRAMRDRRDATPLLPTIGVPTLVLCGVEDSLTPRAECEALAAAVPGATCEVLPGAGHLANLEAAPAFTGALGRWLTAR